MTRIIIITFDGRYSRPQLWGIRGDPVIIFAMFTYFELLREFERPQIKLFYPDYGDVYVKGARTYIIGEHKRNKWRIKGTVILRLG